MADLARSILDKWGWAILAALVSVAISTGWYQAKVAELERDIIELRLDKKAAAADKSDVAVALARLSEQIAAMREQIARIEARDRRTDANGWAPAAQEAR